MAAAIAGGRVPEPPRTVPADASAIPSPGIVAEASAPVDVADRPTTIVLDVPSSVDALVTTPTVIVRGRIPRDVGRLQILLQTRAAAPIVVVTAEPLSAARTGWHDQPATFAADLALPDPRPTGPAVIQIVSYDRRGRARDVLLRPIIIGGLVRRSLGEDGLVGGIVVGTPMEERTGRD